MTTPPPGEPGRDLDAEALSRVLDGLELDPAADPAERDAHVRAEDDVAALRRALLLIGDTFAEPAAAPFAAAAAAPALDDSGDDAKGAVVLPFAARLRAKAPFLAAAASIVAVIGLGAVLVNTGGSETDSTSAAQQPDGVAAAAAPESAPEAAYAQGARGDALAAETDAAATSADTATKAAAPAAGEAKAERLAKKSAPANDEAGTGLSPTAPQQKSPAKTTSSSALDAATTCSRAIFVGTVKLLIPSTNGYLLTVDISDPITNSSLGWQTYAVGENYAQTPDGQQDLTVGREFLFVIPQSTTKAVYGFADPDADARKQVDEARDRTKGANC